MMKILMFLIIPVIVLATSGCSSFWEAKGEAARIEASASVARANADQRVAAALVLDAEGRNAIAESQANALNTTIEANTQLMREAIRLADRSEYMWLMFGLAFGALAIASLAVYSLIRRPVVMVPQPGPPMFIEKAMTIETSDGRSIRLIQEPDESLAMFIRRCQTMAQEIDAGVKMLSPPR